MTPTHLRILPRAADLTLVADPTLDHRYDADWIGAAPRFSDRNGDVDVRYARGGRLHALAPRATALTLRLNPAVAWSIELEGGVSGLRADLRDLRVAAIAIRGGAKDVEVDLPAPQGELTLRIEGGASQATIRRPAGVPVALAIDGGATHLRLDEQAIGAAGGKLRLATAGRPGADRVAVQVLGGASRLAIGAEG